MKRLKLWFKRNWYFFLLGLILFIALFYRRDVFYKLFRKYRELLDRTEKELLRVKIESSKKEKRIKKDYERRLKEIDEEVEREFRRAKKEGLLDALAERLFGDTSDS